MLVLCVVVRFAAFYREFGSFIKEGACTDAANKPAIAKLLRFESSYEPPAAEKVKVSAAAAAARHSCCW